MGTDVTACATLGSRDPLPYGGSQSKFGHVKMQSRMPGPIIEEVRVFVIDLPIESLVHQPVGMMRDSLCIRN